MVFRKGRPECLIINIQPPRSTSAWVGPAGMPGARVADPLRPPLPAVGGATPVAHMAPVARTRAPVVPVPHEGVVRRDGRRRGREGGKDHQATRMLGLAAASPSADPPPPPPLLLRHRRTREHPLVRPAHRPPHHLVILQHLEK